MFSTHGKTHHQELADVEVEHTASWHTTRTSTRSRLSYAAQTTLSFALVAIMTIALLAVVLTLVWERQFASYTRNNMEVLAEGAASDIVQAYAEEGFWSDELIASLGSIVSVSSDVGVQISDAQGTILYDDTWEEIIYENIAEDDPEDASDDASENDLDEDAPADASDDASEQRTSLAPTDLESSVTTDLVLSDGTVIGSIRLWALGSNALLTKADEAFRSQSYSAILITSIIAIVLACIIGAIMAHSLSLPLKRITSAAASLRAGNLTARSHVHGADEIGQLGETFDDMATSLERDLKLEHQLTSDVAHELRTPLMALQATVEAMQDGVMPCDDEQLAVVGSEVRRLSRLVDGMLQLSRMENSTTPFNPERCDVVALVRNLILAQEQLFLENGLTLSFHNDEATELEGAGDDVLVEDKPIYAEIDSDLITRAVTNLLSNAMRYTPEGGSVDVRVSVVKGDVLISVSDTGIGIAPEDLSRVFSRFWRAESSRERSAGGLGIGLALTKHIIDKHNGFVSVQSQVGKGSTFMLHIPLEHHKKQSRKRSSATIKSEQKDSPA